MLLVNSFSFWVHYSAMKNRSNNSSSRVQAIVEQEQSNTPESLQYVMPTYCFGIHTILKVPCVIGFKPSKQEYLDISLLHDLLRNVKISYNNYY